jgi:hypothetical protein
VPDIIGLLNQVGFGNFEYRQTVYNIENILHEVKDGYGSGGFVVIKTSAWAGSKK